jgi:hypothetical protein
MKKTFSMLISVLICGMALTSCSADEAAPKPIPSVGLYVIGTKSESSPASFADLVFSGDDIVSFDATILGNIIFTKEKTDEITSCIRRYSVVHFFIDGKPVFSPPVKIWFLSDSCGDLDMKLCISDDGIMQLRDVTIGMNIHWINEEAALEYAAKMQERRKELDVLINYLRDAGKIVDGNSDSEQESELNFKNDILHGKWKLIWIKSFTIEEGDLSFDYSHKNIIYEFKPNNVLIVSGNVNGTDYRGHGVGEHFYDVTIIEAINNTLGLPAPHTVNINTIPYSFSFGYMPDKPGMEMICRGECNYAFYFIKE